MPIHLQSFGFKERTFGGRKLQGAVCIPPLLVDIPIYLYDSSHTYVEVVLHGKTEGKFLDDSRAHCRETMGDVSKLGGFW